MAEPGRVLAVDYGARRTGLAISDPLGIAAHPLPPVDSRDLQETVQAIVRLVQEREVRRVLVGMPYLRDGREGEAAARTRLFLSALGPALPAGVGLETWDERFTTAAAEQLLREAGLRRRDFQEALDSVAAVVILREYLAGGSPFEPPGSGPPG